MTRSPSSKAGKTTSPTKTEKEVNTRPWANTFETVTAVARYQFPRPSAIIAESDPTWVARSIRLRRDGLLLKALGWGFEPQITRLGGGCPFRARLPERCAEALSH